MYMSDVSDVLAARQAPAGNGGGGACTAPNPSPVSEPARHPLGTAESEADSG